MKTRELKASTDSLRTVRPLIQTTSGQPFLPSETVVGELYSVLDDRAIDAGGEPAGSALARVRAIPLFHSPMLTKIG